jgi:DNA mismatch repair protein MutS2
MTLPNAGRMPMNEHTLKLLSFSQILEELRNYCQSSEAQLLLDKKEIHTEREAIEYNLNLAVHLRKLLETGKDLPTLRLPDLRAFIFRLKKQGTLLEPQELSALAQYIYSSSALKRFLLKNAHESLRQIAEAIPDLDGLRRDIWRIIDVEGNIIDKKVPVLAAIKGRIKNIYREIEKLSKSYLHNQEYTQFWQTDVATIKDGRTVLPLKAQFKGRVKGIVHEVSASGATIFIEPQEIVEKNNQLVIEENKYKQEVLKIIKRLSSNVRAVLPDIILMLQKTAFLDVLLAKVRYAKVHDCTPAEFSQNELMLYEARHPLLGKHAVPITVTLSDMCQVLLITGPNTGGKTVSLKTVGLLVLMHQFGMEIPVKEGSVLPVFDKVLADIGDEQSIEQSLSTFSAHMTNIAMISGQATRQSLVLLDELGAGTDPEEGTAIAMAILDYLIKNGSRVIATTHHGILKNYGYIKHSVTNASVDFDTRSLTPTYELIIGVPGESHALIIAGRNGIPQAIIKQAESYLKDERTDISRLIGELSKQQKDLLLLQEQHKQKERLVEEKLKQTELKELKLVEQEYRLREQGLKELNDLLHASRKELEKVVKEIRENHEREANIKRGRDLISKVEERVAEESQKLSGKSKSKVKTPHEEFKIGSRVLFKDSSKCGTVVRKARGGKWVVETDNVRVSVAADEIELDDSAIKTDVTVSLPGTSTQTLPVFELNVRGFRLPDALRSVEKQLDAAVVQGFASFTILHGKGHGILQEGIHDYLKQNPYVTECHFARPEEGGSGKTIVILKV